MLRFGEPDVPLRRPLADGRLHRMSLPSGRTDVHRNELLTPLPQSHLPTGKKTKQKRRFQQRAFIFTSFVDTGPMLSGLHDERESGRFRRWIGTWIRYRLKSATLCATPFFGLILDLVFVLSRFLNEALISSRISCVVPMSKNLGALEMTSREIRARTCTRAAKRTNSCLIRQQQEYMSRWSKRPFFIIML